MTQDTLDVPELTGMQKAALVLMNMSTERASAVLKSFSLEEQEQITEEMARMRRIDGSEAQAAIEAFRKKTGAEWGPSPTQEEAPS